MKYCDTCRSNYPNDFTTCPKDQAVLRFSSELSVGMVIRDKYQILRRIGAGGMATVYEAKHLAFNEIRALKVVNSRLAEDEAFLKRFRAEAVVTRKLQHPNAVRVDDFDTTEDGRPYIVMEYVEGKDLRHAIEDAGPFSIPRTLNIGKQIASALAEAHNLGITHRDIKPDNILLIRKPDGTDMVKVLDFGIAKIRDGAADMGTGYTTTKTGVVVGTPQYMSPEQAMGKSGEAIDGRSDIYSLGCALYEMLTGQLPFESETPVGLLIHHIQTTPVPPHQRAPQQRIPYALSMVLMKAMEKEKDHRYQSAEEMIEALDQALHATTAMMGSAPELGARTDLMGSAEAGPAAAVARKRITPRPMTPPPRPPAPVMPAPRAAARPVPVRQEKSKAPMWAGLILLLAVGGGGYWYTQRPAAAATTPVVVVPPPAISDDSIQAKIKSTMSGSSALRDVEVTVKDGIVNLGGHATKFSDADTAVALVSGLSGVKEVHNNISTGPVVETKETPALVEPKKESAQKKERVVVPRGPDAKTLAHVRELVASGNRQVDSGDYQTAINAFQSALVLDPNSTEAESGLKRANQAKQTEEDILRRRK
jgi:tRNA A-37 threonylcarbamoyl transferase component Bud32